MNPLKDLLQRINSLPTVQNTDTIYLDTLIDQHRDGLEYCQQCATYVARSHCYTIVSPYNNITCHIPCLDRHYMEEHNSFSKNLPSKCQVDLGALTQVLGLDTYESLALAIQICLSK